MCTAISYRANSHFFGRTLDLEYSYKESVTVTPRNYVFSFRDFSSVTSHYAMIGMATVSENYPLYYDAMNECGVCMAGLNFPQNAVYCKKMDGYFNIAPFEIIPWVLSQCKNTSEAVSLLKQTNVMNLPFNDSFPLTPLHWLLADEQSCFVLEPYEDGLHIFEDHAGVLTNNPPFEYQMQNLCNFRHLSEKPHENTFNPSLPLEIYSRGLGAFGMPGDFSSQSRFVRASFVLAHSPKNLSDTDAVTQFFHILNSVSQPYGSVAAEKGFVKTVYSSCCDCKNMTYYYSTYENRRLCAVHLLSKDLQCDTLIRFPLAVVQDVLHQN